MWTWQTRKQQNGDKCGTTLVAGYRFIPLPWLAILSNQQLKWKGFHRDCPHSLIDCSLASRVLHVNPRSLTFGPSTSTARSLRSASFAAYVSRNCGVSLSASRCGESISTPCACAQIFPACRQDSREWL